MKPHKHAELIKAWADGASIEMSTRDGWLYLESPGWSETCEYRIKPEKILYAVVGEYQEHHYHYEGFTQITDGFNKENFGKAKPNIKLTFDGETGELKSAEVLK